ncbi:MAG: hypothetical protein WC086_02555 [Dehalococcoidales bacterium]
MVQKATKQDKNGGVNIPPKHEQALFLIAAGMSVTDAAAEVGLGRQTLSRLINQNIIARTELARLRSEQTKNITDRLRRSATKAADIIDRVLDDENIDILDRLKAALAIVGKISSQVNFKEDLPVDVRIAARIEEQYTLTAELTNMLSVSDNQVEERIKKEYRELSEAESAGK